MKEVIREKLNNMDDLEQRNRLKNILWDVFKELVDYQEEFNKQLEKKIFDEIDDSEENFSIYTTIVKRKNLSILSDFLQAMKKEDEEEVQYDKKVLLEKINENKSVKISTVFIEESYNQIERIKNAKHMYSGKIVCEDREIPIILNLEYNDQYIMIEKDMHNNFIENGVRWKTVFNPYIRRCFDVIIVDCDEDLSEVNDFKEITFDLEEYQENTLLDFVPVWNIKKIDVKTQGFPLPANDKVNYEHVLSFDSMGVDNGYLIVPNQNFITVRKTKENLLVVSKDSEATNWEVFEFNQDEKLIENEKLQVKLLSNKRKKQFTSRFVNKEESSIKSIGELNRLVNSFEMLDGLTLEKIEILNRVPSNALGYDFNYYITDELRADKFKKVLCLEFKSEINDYLNEDYISFIVSEIQFYFPEYICKGVIE
ncbi:hypothetical protein [Natronospora cellulosivora (SeqCode)]